MNLVIRAILYSARKWKKTLLVFFLLLAITTLVLSGLAIADAQEEQAEEVRGTTGASFTVERDISTGGWNGNYSTQEFMSEDMIQQIAAVDGIAGYVAALRAQGHTVIMVGDGINDSPALSEADVGIAISDGAAIAQEIADITIAAESLWELVRLRLLSMDLMKRIHAIYRFVLGFNGSLIALGVAGVLPPSTSATLHNLSTLGISLHSMTPLPMKEDKGTRNK